MNFLYIEDEPIAGAREWAEALTLQMGKTFRVAQADDLTELRDPDLFSQYLQDEAVDLIFVACEGTRTILQRFLNATRSLRIPYVFLTEDMTFRPLSEPDALVLSPVTMLEEEVHKAEYLGHLCHYTGCRITLLQAKDYGHRAARNANRIRQFLEKAEHHVEVLMAHKDSMSLHREVPDQVTGQKAQLVVLTASREYGLDDLLFGPAERYVLVRAACPVMLLNPRGDLFSLCD